MGNNRIRVFVVAMISLLLCPIFSFAQTGDKKNEIWAYGMVGKNTIEHFYQGFNVFYTRKMTGRVNLMGGIEFNSKKKGFGGVLAEGRYKLPFKHFNLIFSGRGVYNYYGKYNMNEYLFRLAVHAQSEHFDILFGNSFLGYSSYGSSVFEPITWSVGFGANVMKRSSPWNVGIFLKNYDYFIYENWNINFGVRGYYELIADKVRLTGELLVRPAGNINQLAQKYDTGLKIGAQFKW